MSVLDEKKFHQVESVLIQLFEDASRKGESDLVKKFIDKKFKYVLNGLNYACENGHLEVVKAIVAGGQNITGMAYRLAKESGNTELIEFTKKNYKENTPLIQRILD